MDDHMKKELKKAAKHAAKDQKIASLQAENERLLGILQFSRWTHDTHRPSYALNCLYEGEITIAKFCEWMKAFVAGVDEPLPDVKYRSCGCEFTPKELEAENERLRAALDVAATSLEEGYWETRTFIDQNVPGWTHGDDGPSYPLLKACAKARKHLAKKEPPNGA